MIHDVININYPKTEKPNCRQNHLDQKVEEKLRIHYMTDTLVDQIQ